MIRWTMFCFELFLLISYDKQIQGFVSICSNASWNLTGIIIAGQANSMSGPSWCSTSDTELCQPYGAAMDSSQNVYVADYGNSRVQRWALTWSFGSTRTVAGQASGSWGTSASYLKFPTAVSLDISGNVYVLDQFNWRVQKWTLSATAGTTVAGGYIGTALNQLNYAWGMYVDPGSSIIYVADTTNHRVLKYLSGSATGTVVAGNATGYYGTAANFLDHPWSLVVDSAGTMYIVDSYNHRIQKFLSGSSVGFTIAGQASGVSGSSSVQLNYPQAVMLDGQGYVYVLDSGNQRIQRYASNNIIGTTIFSWCVGSGANKMSAPAHMIFDTYGNLIITDRGNHNVKKFLISCNGMTTVFPVCPTTTTLVTPSIATVSVGTSYGTSRAMSAFGVTDYYKMVTFLLLLLKF